MDDQNKRRPSTGDTLSQDVESLSLSATSIADVVGQGAAAIVPSVTLANDLPIHFAELSDDPLPLLPAKYGNGNAVQHKSIRNKLASLSDSLAYPVRTSIEPNKTQQVMANQFQLQIDPNTTFYEYRLTGFPDSETRNGKRRLLRTAIQSVQFLRDNQDSFATDDVSTIISWVKLHDQVSTICLRAGNSTGDEGAEWRLVNIIDKDMTHRLNLCYLREVDVGGLKAYSETACLQPSRFDPNPIENALNIVIRKCISIDNTLHLNGHKFYLRKAWTDIEPLQALRGLIYAVKPVMGSIVLSVVPTMSAFWRPLLVSEVLKKSLGTFSGDENALRGVRAYITYERGKKSLTQQNTEINEQHSRIKTIRGFGLRCDQQKFRYQAVDKHGNMLPAVDITVADYYRRVYGKSLDFRHLQAVNVGTGSNKTWIAPEYLCIVPDQIYAKPIPDAVADRFHKQSITLPLQTRSRVAEGLAHIPMNKQGQLLGCPALSLDTRMIQFDAARLPYPRIRYAKSTKVVAERTGRWNLANIQFVRGSNDALEWKLLVAPKVNTVLSNKFIQGFSSEMKATGVCSVARHQRDAVTLSNLAYDTIKAALEAVLGDKSSRTPDFIVLLLDKKNQDAYSYFKYLTDKVFVIQSICASAQTFDKQNDSKQYLANIAMKANLKQAGINHTAENISDTLRDTLVLGADVTHPGGGALKGSPSIAAVVGSYEDNGGRFIGRMELQTANEEMIQNLSGMVQQILGAWQLEHKTWPKNVIYYRDGVSASQYSQVLSTEIPQIRKSFSNLGASPPQITAVVATKRHNTRFFPHNTKVAMDNGNTKPGTLVETTVTSPYFGDYYLQSHHAIKGTARPCHYFILQNEMKITPKELQTLTFGLCHTYVRATVGVSYAAPAYYADRLCERGRAYLRDYFSPSKYWRDDYNKVKAGHERFIETERKKLNRNQPSRARNTKRTKAEIDDAKADAEAVQAHMVKYLQVGFHERFYAEPANDEAKARVDSFQKTMYWM